MFTINKVLSDIFIGDSSAATNLLLLKHHKITHILVVGDGLKQKYPEHFVYQQINIYDLGTSKIIEHFDNANIFIKECLAKKGRILVHCDSGISRSPTILVAYLMATKRFSFTHSLEYLKRRHPLSQPNEGFISQLNLYQINLLQRSQYELKQEAVCYCVLF